MTASANFNVGTIGGGSFSTVNVDLHGANDAVVIPGDSTTFADVAPHGSTSGSFTVSDADWYPDGQTVAFVPHNPSLHGHLFGGTPVGTGMGGSAPFSWNYTADFGPGTLVAGQHDIWDIVIADQFGSVATHTLDFLLV